MHQVFCASVFVVGAWSWGGGGNDGDRNITHTHSADDATIFTVPEAYRVMRIEKNKKKPSVRWWFGWRGNGKSTVNSHEWRTIHMVYKWIKRKMSAQCTDLAGVRPSSLIIFLCNVLLFLRIWSRASTHKHMRREPHYIHALGQIVRWKHENVKYMKTDILVRWNQEKKQNLKFSILFHRLIVRMWPDCCGEETMRPVNVQRFPDWHRSQAVVVDTKYRDD